MIRRACFLLTVLFAQHSLADVFSSQVQTQYGQLEKCSQTQISVMKFIDVADAALYSSDCTQLPALTSDLQLSFIYHRDIAAEDFIEAAETLLERNLSATEFQQIEQDLAQFNTGYESVAEGDRYDIRRNQDGLSLFKNNRLVSQHASTTLGQRYYQIWFGDKPFNDKLKQALLEPDD
ncbi:chalcone isomerase family protein [Methylophaga sp.]|jgi:hypothetical protein|uniref:chalcone isomerase family protein n=1 Tax=Methylophaga sp. TaxID=2024840 RepID=UPI0013FEB6D3|nr:chalcone isomerase family protein [Methylophaga sp.]MTI63469.1 hypothetical protein [Methylophaga sp.]